MSDISKRARVGGSATCQRPCVECQDNVHHLSNVMMGWAADEPDHEAAKLGVVCWWMCKHCDSWIECTGGEDEDGPDVSLFAALPPPRPRAPRRRPTLLGDAAVHPSTICRCGHRADSHAADLPSPCGHGRTMPDAEIIARCCEENLTSDPRYGCRCIAFSAGAPS